MYVCVRARMRLDYDTCYMASDYSGAHLFVPGHMYVCVFVCYSALDDDTSYLDEAVAPSVPTTIPGAESSAGVPVDEFGLPQIPQAAKQ